jgi:flagellin
LNETHSILNRMRELSVQAANDTNTGADPAEIQKEMNELIDEVDRIAGQTEFNTQKLLNGAIAGGFNFQIGANASQSINLEIKNMSSSQIGSITEDTNGDPIDIKLSDLKITTPTAASTGGVMTNKNANDAILVIDKAIEAVSSERSKLLRTDWSIPSIT